MPTTWEFPCGWTAWAANQSDAWTMAVELRERVVKRLMAADVPVGVLWSRVMPGLQAS